MKKTSVMNPLTHGFEPSCCTPTGPAMALTRRPSPAKRTTIPRQNTIACDNAFLRVRKNETVIGIIGKTQGVKIDASPAPNAVRRNQAKLSSPPVLAGAGAGAFVGGGGAAVETLRAKPV